MATQTIGNGGSTAGRRVLNISLWMAQAAVCFMFVSSGYMKLFFPIETLAGMWKWPGDLPSWFVRLMGVIDTAGGIGVFLPALTRIKPNLTVLAALGCTALQICAIVFHTSRGEIHALPLNFILLPLSAFILWGRSKRRLPLDRPTAAISA